MIIDYNLQFSDAQALTVDAASTNVIDLGSDRDIGPGTDMKIAVTLDTDMGGTSPTVSVTASIVMDAQAWQSYPDAS